MIPSVDRLDLLEKCNKSSFETHVNSVTTTAVSTKIFHVPPSVTEKSSAERGGFSVCDYRAAGVLRKAQRQTTTEASTPSLAACRQASLATCDVASLAQSPLFPSGPGCLSELMEYFANRGYGQITAPASASTATTTTTHGRTEQIGGVSVPPPHELCHPPSPGEYSSRSAGFLSRSSVSNASSMLSA
jgi:hypothetical protein